MSNRIEVSELGSLFKIKGGVLVWDAPTRGRRKKGSAAGGVNKVSGQLVVEIKGKNYPVSNLIWSMINGEYPTNKIEHINGDKLDNRIENLRELKLESLVITQSLLQRIFTYKDGFLYWAEKPTSLSQVVIGKKAGSIMKNGTKHEYRYIRVGGKRYKAANLIWLYHNGEKAKMLDHINHNPQDDRIENLRVVTARGNARNTVLRETNTSGCVGVSWHKGMNKWLARINDGDGDRVHIGYFRKKENAIRARKEAEKEFNYHENHGAAL